MYKKVKKISKTKKNKKIINKNTLKIKVETFKEFSFTKKILDSISTSKDSENNDKNDISDDDIINNSINYLKLNLAKKLYEYDINHNKLIKLLFN